MYLVPNIHPGSGSAGVPTVQANFAVPLSDWTTLDTVSSMPSGGSVSRSGQAMLYDSTGKLTYAPNNVWLQNNTFAISPWYLGGGTALVSNTNNAASAPDETTTAGVLVTGAAAATWTQNITSNGGDYIVSVWAKVSSGTATLSFGLDGISGSFSVTTTWQRFSYRQAALTAGTRQASILLGTANTTYQLWGAQLEAVTYQTSPSGTYYVNYPTPNTTAAYYGPRFDYDPSTLAAKGLLIEGTRTNLCIYSQTTSDANWTVTGGAKTSTNNDDPFGTSTAMLFTASATTNHFIGAGSYSYTSGTVYCSSCFVKAGTASLVQFTFNTGPFGSSQYANFNLSGAGSVTASSGGTGYITQLANGWYRIAFSAPATATAASAAGVIALISSTTDARLPSFASTGTIYATGWQLEIGAFPTSYIPVPTTGSTARATETFSITGYTNRLLEAYYIDQQTGGSYSGNSTVVSSGAVTISPPTFGWVTSLRAYTNAYAGSIASPSWLSFSRSGNAMMTDSTGTLTFAPNNLLLNTATLSTQTVTTGIIPSCDVLLSFKGTGSVAISGGYTGTLAGTGASTLVSLKFTTTTASLTFTVTGSVTEAQLERVTYSNQPSPYVANTGSQYYGPRYDYDASTVPATPRGLLIEESRANLVLNSGKINGTDWNSAASGTTITINQAIAPDGTMTASTVNPGSTATQTFAPYQIITVTAQAYTSSFYFKRNGYDYVKVAGQGGNGVFFNLAAGTVGTANSGYTGAITNVGNGWYRCSITWTATAGTALSAFYLSPDGATVTFAGVVSIGIFVWGAQLEAGAFATSYIPTTIASVTRAADVAQLTGSALTTLSGTAASAITELNPYAISSNVSRFVLSNAASNRLPLYKAANNTQIRAFNGTTTVDATLGGSATWATGGNIRAASGWDSSTISIVGSNGTVVNGAFGISGISDMTLGSAGGGNSLNGYVRSLAIYNQKLPDAILKQKSAVGAPY